MAVIFFFSSQPADVSDGLSRDVTEVIIRVIDKVYPLEVETGTMADWVGKWNRVVREYAHALMYMVLAMLVINALRSSNAGTLKAVLFSLFICAVYALSDEVHQILVPGRAFEIYDLAVDMLGAAIGLVLYSIGYFSIKRVSSFVMRYRY